MASARKAPATRDRRSRVERPARRLGAPHRNEVLGKLLPILRASSSPEAMLRAVASLLASELGQYCIVDTTTKSGVLRRLCIEHADASLHPRLRTYCEENAIPTARAVGIFDGKRSQVVGAVSARAPFRELPGTEVVRSWMATPVIVAGSPMAVLTMAATRGAQRYDASDLAFFEQIASWVGLGVENALRREAEPRRSIQPPVEAEEPAPVSTQARKVIPI